MFDTSGVLIGANVVQTKNVYNHAAQFVLAFTSRWQGTNIELSLMLHRSASLPSLYQRESFTCGVILQDINSITMVEAHFMVV